METKLDWKKEYKTTYTPPAKPVIVEAAALNYLKIDGQGDPLITPTYGEAVSALYSVSYTIKFTLKREAGVDYSVFPLEGLWWADDMGDFIAGKRDLWRWTMMIAQPAPVDAAVVARGIADACKKKALPAAGGLRFEPYAAGLCVQMMHTGPYAAEAPNIAWMHRFAEEQGYALTGKHQEIYLTDPNRTAPEKMRTVLRQPIQRLAS